MKDKYEELIPIMDKGVTTTYLDKGLSELEKDDHNACIRIRVDNNNPEKQDVSLKMSRHGLFDPAEHAKKVGYEKQDWKWYKVTSKDHEEYVHFLKTHSKAVLSIIERRMKDA